MYTPQGPHLEELFRHPVRARRDRGGAAALALLAVVVGGAFLLAPRPAGLSVYPFGRPEEKGSRVHPYTPIQIAATVIAPGYAGLLAVSPQGNVFWLYPRSEADAVTQVQPGRYEYLEPPGLRLGEPGRWLFIHLVCSRPLTRGPRTVLVGRIQAHLLAGRPLAELLARLRRSCRQVATLSLQCDPRVPP